MFMDNVESVYFNKVKCGGGTGLTTYSSEYGFACALQFCRGKTAVDSSENYRAGSADSLSVADKLNYPEFLTETELYKQKRTHSFCLLGRRSASFLRLNEFFGCGIFPKPSPVPKTAFCKLPESVRLKNLTLAVC